MDILGKAFARPDSHAKVSGGARYAADISLPGMLHMKVVFAGRPHARLLAIDTHTAVNVPGVVAVLTAADVPHNHYGVEFPDQPVLCDRVVRFAGDPVAAVVAESEASASRGAEQVVVQYQDLPGVFDPLVAMSPGAPRIHEEYPDNILHTIHLRRGDVEDGFQHADVIFEREYRTPPQEHAFLEPEAGVAFFDEQARLTVIAAGQNMHADRDQIAAVLKLPQEQVRVVYGPIGGAFGGRQDISVQILLALAACKLHRPVRCVWSRTESMIGHHKRHAVILRHKWGARRDGRLLAAEAQVIADAGAYASTSRSVLEGFHTSAFGPYQIPNLRLEGKAVFTNNIPAGAFRGFGYPQATFAAELQIEHLAELLGLDPIHMRAINCLQGEATLPTGCPLPGGSNLPEILTICAREAGFRQEERTWHRPKAPRSQHKARGIGLAIAMKPAGFGYGYPEGSEARVILEGGASIERVVVVTAAAENGQGAHAALRQICAQTLGVHPERVHMQTADTTLIGDAGWAAASRLTFFAGNAVKRAAEIALACWQDEERPAVGHVRWKAPPTTAPDPETGVCIDVVTLSFGAQAVEVEVDLETGQITLVRVIAVHDPGRIVNPQQTLGQIQGAAIQAQGWAMLEKFMTVEGHVLTDRLSRYLLPTAMDIPADFRCLLLETPDPRGPFGARGVGEIGLLPLAPAIISAIHNATGIWFDHLPVLGEEVFARLRSQRQADRHA